MPAKDKMTVHTSRTIMLKEIGQLMDFVGEGGNYQEALQQNLISKLTSSNLKKTQKYLKQLYMLDSESNTFKCFKYFWGIANQETKPLIAFNYALQHDFLLQDSITPILQAPQGSSVTIQYLIDYFDNLYKGRFTPKTLKSLSQNTASSWKQAGYLQGKKQNIRVRPTHNHSSVAFAMLLAYLDGSRGEYILRSSTVTALGLSEGELKVFAQEAMRRDLLTIQLSGQVTSISFRELLKKLAIHEQQD